MMHPECKPAALELADYVGSTSAMIRYAKQQPDGTEFIVGTEGGLLHKLEKENPGKVFHVASDFGLPDDENDLAWGCPRFA